jgi:hypothetical protein
LTPNRRAVEIERRADRLRNIDRVLSHAGHLRIRARKDLGVSCGGDTPTLALECGGYDRRSATCPTSTDDFIDELHEFIREAHRDLLAHPKAAR